MSDHHYYRERAATERAMALTSEQREVREIHEELARKYEALVEQADPRPTLSIRFPRVEGQLAAS